MGGAVVLNEHDFIQYLTVHKRLGANSIANMVARTRKFCRWLEGNKLLPTRESAELWLFTCKQEGCGGGTLNAYVHLFHALDDYFQSRNIPYSLGKFERFSVQQPAIEVLTADEICRICKQDMLYSTVHGIRTGETSNEMYKCLLLFLALTGVRIQEALDLKRRYLDLDYGYITITQSKNGSYRKISITEPLTGALRALCRNQQPSDYIFQTKLGKSPSRSMVLFEIKRRALAAGVKKRVHPHLFRHSLATELLSRGVDVTVVASILGHKDISTTFKNYLHLADDTKRKALLLHPLVRSEANPAEIIKSIRDAVTSYQLEQDTRFKYQIVETSNSLMLRLDIN